VRWEKDEFYVVSIVSCCFDGSFWKRWLRQERYPTKPIQVVIPFGPGGTHDIAPES